MSLNAALSVASGSLQAIQTQLAVASSNVSNADVEGYSRKTVTKTSLATAGAGTGVAVTSITSSVDPWLLKSIYSATAASSASATLSDYLQELGDSLGALSSDSGVSGNNLSAQLTSLTSALTELASTPTNETLKSSVVSQADQLATSLRNSSAAIQRLREEADSAIDLGVETVNSDLEAIQTLNQSILRATVSGSSTADLEDQRADKIADLSSQIGVTTFSKNDGTVAVYTNSGLALLDGTVETLSFASTGAVSADTTYSGGTLSGVILGAIPEKDGDPVPGTGTDITSKITGGALSALIKLRDSTLPALQDKLDSLALSLQSTFNTAHNAGTGATQPNSLNGTVSGLSGANMTASGALTVAVTDGAGTTVAASTFDLSAYHTVDELVTAIAGDTTLGGSVSASLDATTGKVTLSAANTSHGLALSGGAVTQVGSTSYSGDGVSLSAAFGLNDFLIGTGADDIAVRSDLLASPSLLATKTLSSSSSALAAGGTIVVESDSQIQGIADALDASGVALKAANLVSQVSTDLTAAKATASSDETALTTLTSSFSSKYGVNVDEETATIQSLAQSYAASAQVVSTVKSMFESLLEAVR